MVKSKKYQLKRFKTIPEWQLWILNFLTQISFCESTSILVILYLLLNIIDHFRICFKTSRKTFHIKMSWSEWKWAYMRNSFSYEWFRTKTRFDTEEKGNSEMAQCLILRRRILLSYYPVYANILWRLVICCGNDCRWPTGALPLKYGTASLASLSVKCSHKSELDSFRQQIPRCQALTIFYFQRLRRSKGETEHLPVNDMKDCRPANHGSRPKLKQKKITSIGNRRLSIVACEDTLMFPPFSPKHCHFNP